MNGIKNFKNMYSILTICLILVGAVLLIAPGIALDVVCIIFGIYMINGDAEPCVFIHYSGANIRTNTLLEILNQPLFMAYRKNQPFNKNHLRPCPMLENPEILQKMVKETGAKSTDLQSPETAEHLCSKCVPYANAWKPYADKIWSETPVKKSSYENYGHC